MNNSEFKQIEDRLVPPPAPEPPEDLLEKIQSEIPEVLTAVPRPTAESGSYWRVKLMAASVVMVVMSGAVVYQLSRQAPTLEEEMAEEPVPGQRLVSETPAPSSGAKLPLPDPRPDDVDARRNTEAERRRAKAVAAGEEPPSREVAPADEKDLVGSLEVTGRQSGAEGQSRRDQPEPIASLKSRVIAESPPSLAEQDERGQRVQVEAGVGAAGKEMSATSAPPETDNLPEKRDPFEDSSTRRQRLEFRGPRPVGPPAALKVLPNAPSTGGTAEPNEAPYGDMFFRPYGTNPFIDTEDDNLSTFGLDVDTGSLTLARSYLDRGHLPPPEAIRVEEFVNYFDYRDPVPRRGEFTLVAEGAPSLFATGPRYQLVRFGIKAREISSAARKPAVLIFVVDVSGSMRRENRLVLVKRSLELLLDELQRDDEIGLVVYGSRGEVILEPTTSKEEMYRAIERLVPGGSTNAEEGLDLAYRLARRFYREGAINRLILCSDGVANVGRTGPESILGRVRGAARDGIELTTVGFGMGNYNDVLMEQLADQGDGSYAYVDSIVEARRIFVENLTGTLQTIAADAKVQVEFNPETVSRYRLLGYENRDIADERFRDDTVDAGEIGAGHAVTALYEIKLREGVGRKQRLATLRLRYRSKASDEVVETAIDLSRKHLASSWDQGSAAVQLSSLAAEFAEILKGSYWAKDSDLDDLHRRLQVVADELAADEDVEELLYLVERARRLPFPERNVVEE